MPFLHRIYHYFQQEQANNVSVQQAFQQQRQNDKVQEQARLNNIRLNINNKQAQNNRDKQQIADYNQQITDLKNSEYTINKEAKMKMWIGLIILIPLTLYLFLFYSSTFYSSFFRNWEDGGNVFQAMFDPHALSNAASESMFELCLILVAPIIFLGLGFTLHFFSKQTGRVKYLKMAAMVLVTFVFDAILAYLIGKHLHGLAIMTGEVALGSQYTLGDALKDVNTWAVIFCGFIVYIIWGIVFDMTMDAYSKLDLNKVRRKALQEKINNLNNDITKRDTQILQLQNNLNSTEAMIEKINNDLAQRVYIDYNAIRLEMTDFHSGWMQQMGILQCSQEHQNRTNQLILQTINDLIPQTT